VGAFTIGKEHNGIGFNFYCQPVYKVFFRRLVNSAN